MQQLKEGTNMFLLIFGHFCKYANMKCWILKATHVYPKKNCLGIIVKKKISKRPEGVALLVADPVQCNSTTRQNPPIHNLYCRYFEPIIKFQNILNVLNSVT